MDSDGRSCPDPDGPTSSVMRTLVRSDREAGRSPIRKLRSCCPQLRSTVPALSPSRRRSRPRLGILLLLLLLRLLPPLVLVLPPLSGLLNRTRSDGPDSAPRPAALAPARSMMLVVVLLVFLMSGWGGPSQQQAAHAAGVTTNDADGMGRRVGVVTGGSMRAPVWGSMNESGVSHNVHFDLEIVGGVDRGIGARWDDGGPELRARVSIILL